MDSVLCERLQRIVSFARGRKFLWFYGDSLVRLGWMVEFVVRVNQQRTAYIPKEIVENLGYEWTLVPNARTAVIYPRQCSLDTAIKSLQIILDGLKLRLTAEKGEAAT